MTQQKRDLLDDALCMVDEDLLARVMENRPTNEGRGARKLIHVFGRQVPTLLASLVAVGILLVGVAAIPGIVRMARLLLGDTPPPMPPVGGSMVSTEQDDSAHIHDWSPWVPWGDGTHERHCQTASCGAQEWGKHDWTVTRVDENGMLFTCERCSDDGHVSSDSPLLLKNLKPDGILSIELASRPEDDPATSRVITAPATIEAIVNLFRTARYVPRDMTQVVYRLAGSMTIRYADGTEMVISALNPTFAVSDENGCLLWQYLSFEDKEALDGLLTPVGEQIPDSSGTLMVNGERVDCGTHRPLFREYPTGDGVRPTVFVPLTVTLRAVGAEVGEAVNGQVSIRLNGRNYTLFIFSRTLREDISSQNLLAAATGASDWIMQSGTDELMVDSNILFENVLYAMCGERMLWHVTADYGTGYVWVTKSESQAAMHALRTLPIEGLQQIEETNFPDSPTNDRFIANAEQLAEIVRCLRELSYTATSVDAGGMDGSTMELTFFYENGKIIHIYLFGNQFVRIDDGGEALPWLSIGLSDAAALLRVIFGT